MFGRVIGVLAASVNAIIQLAYLPHYPLWSFTMILVDILVIWGIVVHGGRLIEGELSRRAVAGLAPSLMEC